VFIDGVYRSRSGIGLNELGEIDRIEVLRGPQGTLGGRNASAGMISIVSKAPAPLRRGREFTYGNFDYWRLGQRQRAARRHARGARRRRLVEARRLLSRRHQRSRHQQPQPLFRPRPAAVRAVERPDSVRLIGDYTKRSEECCAATYVNNQMNPYIGNLNDPPRTASSASCSARPAAAAFTEAIAATSMSPGRSYFGTTEDWGASGQIDYDLGGAKLTSITGYRDYFERSGIGHRL
jgi:iron complex outermembrane receptor protein